MEKIDNLLKFSHLDFFHRKMELKVFQWNILNPYYVTEKYFPEYEKNLLDENVRLEKILNILQEVTKENYVICLQEIPLQWQGVLFDFFDKNNYKFIISSYGKMAISISFPRTFESGDTRAFVISEIDFGVKKEDTIELLKKAEFNPNLFCATNKNKILYTFLKFGERKICISTMHMPCMFSKPEVMKLLSENISQKIEEISMDCSLIFAGDFNINFDSEDYKIFCKRFNCDSKGLITTKTKFFSGCIDYIFYKKINSIILEDTNIENPLPDENIPSDHVYLKASFTI